jgi:predicted nucleic acid-binding protein
VRGFADTSWFGAILSTRDQHHEAAVAASRRPWRQIVTTEFVLIELGATFSKPDDRPDFLLVDRMVRTRADVLLIPATSELFQRGRDLFAARPDKAWSLTDCTSFAVMEEYGLTEALTADHHYTQAGFHALLAVR